jgi:hypothetical protein
MIVDMDMGSLELLQAEAAGIRDIELFRTRNPAWLASIASAGWLGRLAAWTLKIPAGR